jgi:hypothetical protein
MKFDCRFRSSSTQPAVATAAPELNPAAEGNEATEAPGCESRSCTILAAGCESRSCTIVPSGFVAAAGPAAALVDDGSSGIPAFLRRDVSGASLRGVAIGASGSRPLSSDSLLRLDAGGAALSPAAAPASFLSLAPRAKLRALCLGGGDVLSQPARGAPSWAPGIIAARICGPQYTASELCGPQYTDSELYDLGGVDAPSAEKRSNLPAQVPTVVVLAVVPRPLLLEAAGT